MGADYRLELHLEKERIIYSIYRQAHVTFLFRVTVATYVPS